MTRRKVALGAAAAVGIGTALLTGTAGADNGGKPYHLALSGANEFSGGAAINPHGDDDRGSITLRLNPGQEEVCWSAGEITLTAGEPLPHVAHIHEAPAEQSGPVRVDLFGTATTGPAPTSYPTGTTCVHAPRDRIKDIMHNPEEYYVNFHNRLPAGHPAGVMRAQMG